MKLSLSCYIYGWLEADCMHYTGADLFGWALRETVWIGGLESGATWLEDHRLADLPSMHAKSLFHTPLLHKHQAGKQPIAAQSPHSSTPISTSLGSSIGNFYISSPDGGGLGWAGNCIDNLMMAELIRTIALLTVNAT